MVKTAKQTKLERRRARAEAQAAARRRRERRRRLGWWLGGAAVVALVSLSAISLLRTPEETSRASDVASDRVAAGGTARAFPLAVGDAVPSFSAPGLTGGRVSWSDVAGRPALLAVWAPWCPHCQVELPVLDRVMRRHPRVGFLTVVTAVGQRPGPTPEGYMLEHDLAFPVAMDDADGTLARAFGIEGFPTLYFVGSDGRVVRTATGEVDEGTLQQILASLS